MVLCTSLGISHTAVAARHQQGTEACYAARDAVCLGSVLQWCCGSSRARPLVNKIGGECGLIIGEALPGLTGLIRAWFPFEKLKVIPPPPQRVWLESRVALVLHVLSVE